ncbi:helix-turn-helix transcriptional regulator [Coleofasciculus sp. FACHB-SPT9]|uniref:helix-turn-helix domain-containing protein n=1 Tax=Cyanophyceae TaxID=3028117 RepID=UPI001688B0CD|nr:helix-turn-helix transcriptional regulator [Coleofasciculus sp. FACHB-SPT9]MBD1892948.1 helix-turn-helix transcriptional regulator [Coleofasciculus sp. FACHB-SPT9]
MPVSHPLEIAALVRETRFRLGLTQAQFAEKLGVSFQSVNRWENKRTKPLPIVHKHIEEVLRQMGEHGIDVLGQYFPEYVFSKQELR